MDFPLVAIIGITGTERERNQHMKGYKAKLERLRLARLTRHDQAVKLLDMQKLQAMNTHKTTTINFNLF
jgi:hypothetical protein